MTLKIYIGTADEITARLAGTPNATQTTLASVTSKSVVTLTSATSFSADDSIVIGKEKAVIDSLDGAVVTLKEPLASLPSTGATVRHYNADYTQYRDQAVPFVFVDDRKTGGQTGTYLGQDLTLFDYDAKMPDVISQNRITIFESTDPATPLFAGVIVASNKTQLTKNGNEPVYQWQIEAEGYQWEADGIGINEQPFTNINAGNFLNFLRSKWTNLSVGTIDTVNSPRVDYIRLANFRRFSDVGNALAEIWPGGEFFIGNNHTGGSVYYRQEVQSYAPITLNQAYLEKIGNRQDQYINVRTDYDKVYNMVLLPYYREQLREPDFHVQSSVTDDAFLKTSVTLAGQPASVEESQLLFDDFSGSSLNTDFLEFDKDNPNPPEGFNEADGYLVQGQINSVPGLHLLDTSAAAPAIVLGDIGRVTDPAEVEPFTGAERQMIFAQEIVVNQLGEAIILGVTDQTSRIMTVTNYEDEFTPTTTACLVSFNGSDFDHINENDQITIGSYDTIITHAYWDGLDDRIAYIEYEAIPAAPDYGVAVTLKPMNTSRIAFGVYFKDNGDLKYIKDGVETTFDTPRVYTAGPSTYSIRLYMQAFETVITGGINATGCTLDDPTNFNTGDVVEIFTTGSRTNPERRVITVTGSDIEYEATNFEPAVGYRIRTLPKMVLQIKGGTEYGDITGRDWTTIYQAENTWQDSASSNKDDYGVLLVSNKSLVGTITQFQMKDPIPVTAMVNGGYLHIGTQETDPTEADIDCILRKVGSHYQLDFFPDTKALWSSGSTLELRYKERWRQNLESKDLDSMRAVAKVRGYELVPNATEQELVRRGGRALDTIDILPNPISDFEAIAQSEEILKAVSSPAVTVDILTNTYLDELCRAGQIIPSELTGVPDVVIQRVQITEIPGISEAGSSLYRQLITAGTVDRLSDILKRRAISGETRIVIDEGASDDTFTSFQKSNITEQAINTGIYTTEECTSPSDVLWNGSSFSKIKCITFGENTGWKYATAGDNSPAGGALWIDVNNAGSLTDYASVSLENGDLTTGLLMLDYDFSLPVNASGIMLRISFDMTVEGLADGAYIYIWTFKTWPGGDYGTGLDAGFSNISENGTYSYSAILPGREIDSIAPSTDDSYVISTLNDPSFGLSLEVGYSNGVDPVTVKVNKAKISISYK